MVFCYFVVGLGVGALIQHTIDAHIHNYKATHPIPTDQTPATDDPNLAAADDTTTSANPPIPQAST